MKAQEALFETRNNQEDLLLRRIKELEQKVSDLNKLHRELSESEEKYRMIADHSGDCLWIADLKTLHFTYVSPAVKQIYGSTPESTIKDSIADVMPPYSLETVKRILQEELALEAKGADPGRSRTIEIQEYRKDRSIVWIENVLSFIRDDKQRPVAILGVSRDVTERRLLSEELRNLAVTDPLTGAFNRRHFMEELNREMERSDRYSIPLSLIMLDLDNFKNINDLFGHETGDRVLKGVVDLIRKRIRLPDVLARWGGEEFMIMLVNTALKEATKLSTALLESLRKRIFPEVGSLTASFGVTQYVGRESTDNLLTRVDDLMYQAKQTGRARIISDVTRSASRI